MDGLISKIQRYSTKDGPGIRSTVFAVGCNLRCKWCSNPELLEEGKIFYHKERCVKCGACEKYNSPEERAAVCFHDVYEHVGTLISAEVLASKLLRDNAFYVQSGGGVTFSGGEPVLQKEFFLETTRLLKSESVHVALDTAGHVPWDSLLPLVEAADLVLYDIKAIDETLHKQLTGAGNSLILENAGKIAGMKKPMVIRTILVPGVNDAEEEISRRLEFISSLGAAGLDILKYHRLGAGKYLMLGKDYPAADVPECPDELAERVMLKARSMGLTVTIGG